MLHVGWPEQTLTPEFLPGLTREFRLCSHTPETGSSPPAQVPLSHTPACSPVASAARAGARLHPLQGRWLRCPQMSRAGAAAVAGAGLAALPLPACPSGGPPQLRSQGVLTDRRVDAAYLLGGQLQPGAPAQLVGGVEDRDHHGPLEPSQGGQMPDAGHQLLRLGNRQVGRGGGGSRGTGPPAQWSARPTHSSLLSPPCLRGPAPGVLVAADSPRSDHRAGRPASRQAAQGLEEA